MTECEKPCDPCLFGGFQKDENAQVKVSEKNLPDCRMIANEKKEQVCSMPEPVRPISESSRPVLPGNPPCYLPQSDLNATKAGSNEKMGPIGPWATGRVDWGPLAGLTGTRPVVAKYSITRYSEGEWRQRNADLFNANYLQQDECNL